MKLPAPAVVLAFSLFCTLLGGCSKREAAPMSGVSASPAPATEPAPGTATAQGADAIGARRALLEIHATVEVRLDKADRAEALADRLGSFAVGKGGYVAESRSGSDPLATHLVLRVPPADLPAVRGLLAGEGAIVRESETAKDVTDAIADLDARLRSARVEETRILRLIEDKSGTIADVLAAERALGDVRQRIERLESEQHVAQGRVDLATLEVTLRHPAAGGAPDLGLAQRTEDAARDGVKNAETVLVALLTLALRAGPTLLVLGAPLIAILFALRRTRKSAPTSRNAA
jgi:hypothetical protein